MNEQISLFIGKQKESLKDLKNAQKNSQTKENPLDVLIKKMRIKQAQEKAAQDLQNQKNSLLIQQQFENQMNEIEGQVCLTELNVQKIKLSNKPELFENRPQYEAFLKQTVNQQMDLIKRKRDRANLNLARNFKSYRKKIDLKKENMDQDQDLQNRQFKSQLNHSSQYNNSVYLYEDVEDSYNNKQQYNQISVEDPNINIDLTDFDYNNKLKKKPSILEKIDQLTEQVAMIPQMEQKRNSQSQQVSTGQVQYTKNLKKYPNPFDEIAQQQQKLLQQRKEAQQKYSEISKNRYKQDEFMPYKYVIRPGNNSQLVQRVFEESDRFQAKQDQKNTDGKYFPGWEPADDQLDSLYNFLWKPVSNGINFDMISKHGQKQLVNHIYGHWEITTKDRLFLNMKAYYESQKLQNIFQVLPLTIVIDYMKDNVGEQVQLFFQLNKIIEKVCSQPETDLSIPQQVEQINNKMKQYQLQNQKNTRITQLQITESCHNRQNLWLLKPTGFNRGIGIHIFRTFEQLCEIMSNSYGIGRGSKDRVSIYQPHKNLCIQDTSKQDKMQSNTFVIQKLIERPLLFNQRKFDIRVWVLVNSTDGKCYQYREGYVRTSSKIYQENFDSNICSNDDEYILMQLTNNAIQKNGEEYGKFEEGNIISFHKLFEYIENLEQSKDQTSEMLFDQFKSSMATLIANSLKSVKQKLQQQKYTFELMGYDFIMDEKLNTYLIEVNTNPCLEESNSLLKSLVPRMLDDMFNIVCDPIFYNQSCAPTESQKLVSDNNNPIIRKNTKNLYVSKYKLQGQVFDKNCTKKQNHPGYMDDENLFDLICTLD